MVSDRDNVGRVVGYGTVIVMMAAGCGGINNI